MAEPRELSRVVIADAGPLIALSRVHQLDLLHSLFGAVAITEQIRSEALDGGHFPGQDAIAAALQAGWLRSHVIDLTDWRAHVPGVDEGEASAMRLAAQYAAPLLIIDDRAGRAEARARNFAVMGVAAVVGLARRQGLVALAAPILDAMRANGYYIGVDVIAAVLSSVGEAARGDKAAFDA
jgi:predicted nucleic acid-binding protein